MREKIKLLLKYLHLDVKKYNIAQNQELRLKKILENFNINVVYDVGANSGQFGEELRMIQYSGNIVSFEPLNTAYNELLERAKRDVYWQVADRTAIGDFNGFIDINIAGNLASSSILKMNDTHIQAAPTTATVGLEHVPIRTLDSLIDTFLSENSVLFIKIDTQGFEDKVLNGAGKTLERTKIVQMELSLVELYSDQKLILEMILRMKNLNFSLWGLEPAFIDSSTGRMLQVDAIFVKD